MRQTLTDIKEETWSSNSHSKQSDFKIKTITRGKEGHYIMIKGPILEEDMTIVNMLPT